MDPANTNRVPLSRLIFGLGLLAFGLLAFAASIDLWDPPRLGSLWPFILIAIGLAGEFDALSTRRRGGSAWVLAVGVWMLFGTQHWFGLSVREAMPIGVVVLGFLIALHAVIDRPESRSEEVQR